MRSWHGARGRVCHTRTHIHVHTHTHARTHALWLPQVFVASKFDNRLKEFAERWEVDKYLSATGYLPPKVRPFFVALPKVGGCGHTPQASTVQSRAAWQKKAIPAPRDRPTPSSLAPPQGSLG